MYIISFLPGRSVNLSFYIKARHKNGNAENGTNNGANNNAAATVTVTDCTAVVTVSIFLSTVDFSY